MTPAEQQAGRHLWDYEGGSVQRVNVHRAGSHEFWGHPSAAGVWSRPVGALDVTDEERRLRAYRAAMAERFARFTAAQFDGYRTGGKGGADQWTTARARALTTCQRWASEWAREIRRPASLREAKVCAFPTLALAGTPGSGKTHLATSALRVLAVEGGCSIAAWPVVDLLSAVKARFDRPELPDPIARCVSADVLLLDDLGAHHRTDWSVQTLYDLISRRYNRNPDGLLILTTNAATADADAFWRGLLADQSNPQVARIADRIRGALVRMHDDDHGPIPSYR